jgi:hypothetical protein
MAMPRRRSQGRGRRMASTTQLCTKAKIAEERQPSGRALLAVRRSRRIVVHPGSEDGEGHCGGTACRRARPRCPWAASARTAGRARGQAHRGSSEHGRGSGTATRSAWRDRALRQPGSPRDAVSPLAQDPTGDQRDEVLEAGPPEAAAERGADALELFTPKTIGGGACYLPALPPRHGLRRAILKNGTPCAPNSPLRASTKGETLD